nr:DNA polymerase I-like [Rhipicephalus microplus]
MMPSHNAFPTQRVCYQRGHLCMVSLVLQMHDELLLEVCEADLNTVSGMVRKSMEEAAELSVPLVVRLRAGPNWAHLDDWSEVHDHWQIRLACSNYCCLWPLEH